MARKQRKPSQLYTEDDPQFGTWKPFSILYDVFSFQTTCWYEFEWMVITVSSNTLRPIQGCMYVCIQKVLPSRGLNWENKEESNLRLFLLFEKKKIRNCFVEEKM